MCLHYDFHFPLSLQPLIQRFTGDTASHIDAFMAFRHFYPETGVMLCPMLYLCVTR
jgi:hypothetical protein